jgi:hypothetical protein
MKAFLALLAFDAALSIGATARAQESEPKPAPPDTGLRAEVDTAAAWRTLFGLDIWGADTSFRIGGQGLRGIGGYAEASYFLGSTPAGLATQLVWLGSRIDVRVVDRLHIGGGFGGVNFDLARASSHTGTISTWGAGLEAFARGDLFQSPPYAVFVELRVHYLSLDTFHNPAVMWGQSLAAGVRF